MSRRARRYTACLTIRRGALLWDALVDVEVHALGDATVLSETLRVDGTPSEPLPLGLTPVEEESASEQALEAHAEYERGMVEYAAEMRGDLEREERAFGGA